ncbi:hypothetical protein Hanom_Chr07g00614761 [Helianthus anomalus]
MLTRADIKINFNPFSRDRFHTLEACQLRQRLIVSIPTLIPLHEQQNRMFTVHFAVIFDLQCCRKLGLFTRFCSCVVNRCVMNGI